MGTPPNTANSGKLAMTTTAPVRISLVGPMRLDGPAGTLDERALGGRQGRVVFAVLAGTRHRPVPKEELAEALWPATLPASWQPALRGVVTKVRSALTTVGLDGARVIHTAFGCYQLELPHASVDVEDASDAVDEAEARLAAGDPAGARPLAEEVGAAIEAAQAAIAVEPFRESAYRLLMSAYAASGSRGEALRVYERCRVLLSDELGVRPSDETEAAYVALLGDEPPKSSGPPPTPRPAPTLVPRAAPLPLLPDAVFVGRESEMAVLSRVAAAAAGGSRQVVVISGEAGVGKTRLALEAAWAAERGGATVLYGAATEGGVLPYEAVLDALTRYVATCSRPELSALFAEPTAALLRLLPEAAAQLPGARPPASVDPDTDRALLFRDV